MCQCLDNDLFTKIQSLPEIEKYSPTQSKLIEVCNSFVLGKYQQEAWSVYYNQIKEFGKCSDIKQTIKYVMKAVPEIFEKAWKYLFRANVSSLGTKTGCWFESLVGAILQPVCFLKDLNVIKPNGKIDKRIVKDNKTIVDIECKTQSDITSVLRNGLSHMLESEAPYSGVICATNAWATQSALEDITLNALFNNNKKDLVDFLNKVCRKKVGVFCINNKHFIAVLGEEDNTHKIWDGSNHANCGGRTGWKPNVRGILETIRFFEKITSNS